MPWAQPPFYANADEQTLMNDCVRSSIANKSSYAQARHARLASHHHHRHGHYGY